MRFKSNSEVERQLVGVIHVRHVSAGGVADESSGFGRQTIETPTNTRTEEGLNGVRFGFRQIIQGINPVVVNLDVQIQPARRNSAARNVHAIGFEAVEELFAPMPSRVDAQPYTAAGG